MLWCDNGTYTTCVEPFNKELAKQLLKLMDALDIKDPEKISAIWIKNLSSVVNKINSTKASIIDMKPKDVIKLDNSGPYKPKTYPQRKPSYLQMIYTDIYISLVKNMEIKKDKLLTLSGVKIHID